MKKIKTKKDFKKLFLKDFKSDCYILQVGVSQKLRYTEEAMTFTNLKDLKKLYNYHLDKLRESLNKKIDELKIK